MSRTRHGPRSGLSLPHTLQKELDLQPSQSNGRHHHRSSRPPNRKEIRKAERDKGAALKRDVAVHGIRTANKSSRAGELARQRAQNHGRQLMESQRKRVSPLNPPISSSTAASTNPIIKSSLGRYESPHSPTALEAASRSPSPALRLDATSQAYKNRAAEEDAEIAALERRLGKKGKKVDVEDYNEIEEILGGLPSDSSSSVGKRKRKGENFEGLQRKRITNITSKLDGENDAELSMLKEGEATSDMDEEYSASEDDVIGKTALSLENLDYNREWKRPMPRQARENPYAPPTAISTSVPKYMPPSRRQPDAAEGDSQVRLQRQLQSALNKLSESNLVSIILEVEKLYNAYPRHTVTSTLCDLLITLFAEQASLSSSFAVVHAAFITGAYRVLGTDFGAGMVARITETIDKSYSSATTANSNVKPVTNLISLLCHLYTFQLIGGMLILDYITMFLNSINELTSELLLNIVRESGHQLRLDDPAALKNIVLVLQQRSADHSNDTDVMSLRTKFMIETIIDLKNNKHKTAISDSTGLAERITQLRKLISSLSSQRTLRATEPLRVGLADIQNRDERGSWWLVGASWRDRGSQPDRRRSIESPYDAEAVTDGLPDLVQIAKRSGMNTSIRRSVFVAIMSANDYQDAYHRLQKLRLKRAQENEISRVLLRCVMNERDYNPYYTLIVKKLCVEKRMRLAFQFGLWKLFNEMDELADRQEMDVDEGESKEQIGVGSIVNAAHMFGRLILDNVISISIIKVLNLPYLKEKARLFAEVLIIVIFQQAQKRRRPEKAVQRCFARAKEAPQMVPGLQHFLTRFVRRSDLIVSADKSVIEGGYEAARGELETVANNYVDEE